MSVVFLLTFPQILQLNKKLIGSAGHAHTFSTLAHSTHIHMKQQQQTQCHQKKTKKNSLQRNGNFICIYVLFDNFVVVIFLFALCAIEMKTVYFIVAFSVSVYVCNERQQRA